MKFNVGDVVRVYTQHPFYGETTPVLGVVAEPKRHDTPGWLWLRKFKPYGYGFQLTNDFLVKDCIKLTSFGGGSKLMELLLEDLPCL